jgi:hypothetical protein
MSNDDEKNTLINETALGSPWDQPVSDDEPFTDLEPPADLDELVRQVITDNEVALRKRLEPYRQHLTWSQRQRLANAAKRTNLPPPKPPLDVECPECKAEPGVECIIPSATVKRWPHGLRVQASHRLSVAADKTRDAASSEDANAFGVCEADERMVDRAVHERRDSLYGKTITCSCGAVLSAWYVVTDLTAADRGSRRVYACAPCFENQWRPLEEAGEITVRFYDPSVQQDDKSEKQNFPPKQTTTLRALVAKWNAKAHEIECGMDDADEHERCFDPRDEGFAEGLRRAAKELRDLVQPSAPTLAKPADPAPLPSDRNDRCQAVRPRGGTSHSRGSQARADGGEFLMLKYSKTKEPRSWCWSNRNNWCGDFPDPWGSCLVMCSAGHASVLQHRIGNDGSLHAPKGRGASLHCGTCDEDLPLQLADWHRYGPETVGVLPGGERS